MIFFSEFLSAGPSVALQHITPCLKKTVPVLFFNNSVKHWPILIISCTQHHEETWRKRL